MTAAAAAAAAAAPPPVAPDPLTVAVPPLAGVRVFPVRHHSPRASRALLAFLDRVEPDVVLVEGPSDADGLIEVLLEPDTVPPIAILAYRTEGAPRSLVYPFASYSPEYVALGWARAHGRRARFIDLGAAEVLAGKEAAEEAAEDAEDAEDADDAEDEEPGSRDGEPEALDEEPDPIDGERPVAGNGVIDDGEELAEPLPVEERAARARGFRSFEELWEAWFEAPEHAPERFGEAILAYAAEVRAERPDLEGRDAAREARMARHVADEIARGAAPARIAVVAGAAHVLALARGGIDPALDPPLPAAALDAPVPAASPAASTAAARDAPRSPAVALTIIPFSFPRLAEQTGYGAGNRAPRYYQRAFDAGGSYRRATLETLIELAEHLRLRGFFASLADVIEAYRLACTLAEIRGKVDPGLDEVREATVAVLCRGDPTHVDGFLWPSVIGRAVGRVGARVVRNALQAEFWREVEARKLPRHDQPERFLLKLNEPVQVGTSIFLHRLRLAEIPYASFDGVQSAGRRAPAEPPGGYAALARSREAWQAQWSPGVDIALAERVVLGDSLAAVAARQLAGRLEGARDAGAAADVLLEGVVAAVPGVVAEALAACERLAAEDDDLASLAGACRALSYLVSFGTSRDLPGPAGAAASAGGATAPAAGATAGSATAAAIPALCQKTFARAVLRVRAACQGDDDAVERARAALRTLHEIALAQPLVDAAAWLAEAALLARDFAAHPACAGTAAGLLHIADRLGDDEVAALFSLRLSDLTEPGPGARFLAGFLDVNALVLVKSRPVVAALDGFLTGLEPTRFRDLLPVLRRSFMALGATERRYLLESIVALRKLGAHAAEARQIFAAHDLETLRAMEADLGQALDDLDDLLGQPDEEASE